MTRYLVERRDISWIEVEAEDPTHALEIANESSGDWEYSSGDMEVIDVLHTFA